jgi:hypothetical protein
MAARKNKAVSGSSHRIPIDELLTYRTNLSKRPTLTRDDFRTFVQMTEKTLEYFFEYYGWRRPVDVHIAKDKFFTHPHSLVTSQTPILEKVFESPRLSDYYYNLMKDFAKKFIPRIKKCFGQQLVHSQIEKTPLQDAEHLLSLSTKLTHRWAAGIIASNHIATLLIRLSNYKKGEKFKDDIITLRDNLKNRTKNPKLSRFLQRSHRRFEDADKTRNRCAHVNEGEPTRQEIEQSISLARLLQKFIKAR